MVPMDLGLFSGVYLEARNLGFAGKKYLLPLPAAMLLDLIGRHSVH